MMRRLPLIAFMVTLSLTSLAQDKTKAENLVSEGIKLHDAGDFEGAIAKYDEALQADQENFNALAEKAMSLVAWGKSDDAIEYCKRALENHAGSPGLKSVYVTYGNALDQKKEPKKSLNIYNDGIKVFPDYYQLHFNKGITLAGMEKYDDALESFHRAVTLNPRHASSHNAIARLAHHKDERVPAILAYSRFLTLEPQGGRAKDNFQRLRQLMSGGAQKTGDNEITINLDEATVKQATRNGKKKENDFSSIDLLLSMSSALDFDDKSKDKTELQLFTEKLDVIFSTCDEMKAENAGFYWQYYVPYFIEMKKKDLTEVFSRLAFASTGDGESLNWIKAHEKEIEKFNNWSNSFVWSE